MMYSAEYAMTLTNLVKLFIRSYSSCLTYSVGNILYVALSANIGVRNSVGFFTCDEFC